MLAAILLNLADYQVKEQQQNGFVSIVVDRTKQAPLTIREAAKAIAQTLGETKQAKRVGKTVKRVERVLTASEFDLSDFTRAQAELNTIMFELRQSVFNIGQIIDRQQKHRELELMGALRLLAAQMDDEEAVLAILLS
jgi:two-component SAPR family response regulator